MNQPIVSSADPIILIGGAQVDPSILTLALNFGSTVVCADGGANTALAQGLDPVAVIGDLDSISDGARAAFGDVLHHIAEQNSTDLDKVLRNITAPLIIGVGFLGDRFDHALGALHVLQKFADQPIVLVGEYDVVFMAPAHLTLDRPVGERVSLMPLPEARVETLGLKWDVTDAAMSLEAFIGTLNEVAQSPYEVRTMGRLAVILPSAALGSVVGALTSAVHAR